MKILSGMNRFSLVWITLLLLLLHPSLAGAMEDGGARSVFATGAGNRALAMGGAFAAVADDPSAPIYNPGGLGLVSRKELQSSQTTLFGLGFSEQYASVVFPHWRLGTFSLVWRSFGVGGIEERDDLGFIINPDLQNSEIEISLGYGRTMLEGNLGLGGGFKVQRQSLASYSGSGFGLDLGLWSRPLAMAGNGSRIGRELTLGLAIRNAIEPEIKLDQEAVSDPTAVRVGLAWGREFNTTLNILTAVDLEKTRNMGRRLHAGVEGRIYRMLDLRVGSADGKLTAGAGLEWRGIGADYQYEDNPLGDIHRFGLSVSFGATVNESRQAYQDAAETELQTRLKSAFDNRVQAQETQLVTEIRQALEGSRWDEALEMIGTLRVLSPDRPELLRMEAVAHAGLGRQQEEQGDLASAALSWRRALAAVPDIPMALDGLARVEAESDLRSQRTREFKARYEAALDAFARDELITARNGFAAVLELSPRDRDAATMLSRTEAALTRRAAALGEEAVSLAQSGQLVAARKMLLQARELDPNAPGLVAAATQLTRSEAELARLAEETAQVAATPVSAPEPILSPQRRHEIDELYRRGLAAMEAQRREEALSYWEVVWSADPDHEQVRQYLGQEYLAQGMEAYADGALRQAVTSWEDALRVAPQDQRARGYLERARQQLSRMEKISNDN